jgi:hypothetical protein
MPCPRRSTSSSTGSAEQHERLRVAPLIAVHRQFNPSRPPAQGARLLPLPVYVPDYSDQAFYQHIPAYLETIVPELAPVLRQA